MIGELSPICLTVNTNSLTLRSYNICVRYPDYMVSMYGIGRGLDGQEHLGCVSQMALFVRRDFWTLTEQQPDNDFDHIPLSPDFGGMNIDDPDPEGVYKLLYAYEIPEVVDRRTRGQRILDEANYQLNFLRQQEERFYNSQKGVLEIPLQMLYDYIIGDKDFDVDEFR